MLMAPRHESASSAQGLRPVAAIRDVLGQLEGGTPPGDVDPRLATTLGILETRARALQCQGGLLATVRLSQEARRLQSMLDTQS